MIFFILPEISKILSSIRLMQHGANKRLNLKKYETIIAIEITSKIIQEILRKYLNSFSVRGFSGVSRGQRMKIITIEIKVMINSVVLKSYIFDNLIIPIEAIIERVDNISHLVSVAA